MILELSTWKTIILGDQVFINFMNFLSQQTSSNL